ARPPARKSALKPLESLARVTLCAGARPAIGAFEARRFRLKSPSRGSRTVAPRTRRSRAAGAALLGSRISRQVQDTLSRLRRRWSAAERFLVTCLLKTEAEHPQSRVGFGGHPPIGLVAGLFHLSAQRLEVESGFADFRSEIENHRVHGDRRLRR